jgi:hypothetical protein
VSLRELPSQSVGGTGLAVFTVLSCNPGLTKYGSLRRYDLIDNTLIFHLFYIGVKRLLY